MAEPVDYQRIRIHADLTLISELHIGNGANSEALERTNDRNEASSTSLFDTVCIDDKGQPYLPGSTLRGVLRDLALTCIDDNERINQLFGQQSLSGVISRLRVQDAFVKSTPAATNYSNSRMTAFDKTLPTRINQGIKIDPIRNVVDEHKLFQFEVVPEKTVFTLVLEGDAVDKETLEILCQLLSGWDEQRVALGRNHLKGNGRISCSITQVEVADKSSINDWLLGGNNSFYKVLNDLPKVDAFSSRHKHVLSYQLQCAGMMLVNDPDRVKNKSDEHNPQHVFAQLESGQAMIPGKAIKGLLRAHARKILMTLLVNDGVSAKAASSTSDHMLNQMFGSTAQASKLSISNALSLAAKPNARKQAFIAVDRFTGGVKEGALYQVEGTLNELFVGDVTFVSRQTSGRKNIETEMDWCKGLLCYVLRDFMQGDGYLGWGKSRGYGRFVLSQLTVNGQTIKRWEDIVTIVSEAELKQWMAALKTSVKLQTETAKSEATS